MNVSISPIVGKIKHKQAKVSVTGSKSITARALLLAAIANGESTLYGIQHSDDCKTFLEAVEALGIATNVQGNQVTIQGCGGKLPQKEGKIYVGSAGTASRFLTAFLAFQEGKFMVDASPQMKARPQKPLIESLQTLGAKFTFLEKEYAFPFIIEGTRTPQTNLKVDITKSSQFLSALLISSVCANQPITIEVEGTHGMDYVQMTLDMMWSFGVFVQEEGNRYTVQGKYIGKKYEIEPDLSSASYFYALSRLLNVQVQVAGVMGHSMQADQKFIQLISNFDGGKVDLSACSDQALTLSALAPYFSKPTEIVGVAHIREQECNRIQAIVENLRAMGICVEEREDGVKILPGKPHGATIRTFGDHRVAMSFALCGLMTEGIVIENAEVCAKTFREYFDCLDQVVKQLTE